MTVIVDVSGAQGVGVACYGASLLCLGTAVLSASIHLALTNSMRQCVNARAGGEEERWAQIEGSEPPQCSYKPRPANIAPRNDSWQASRSNTQTAPRSGAVRLRRRERMRRRRRRLLGSSLPSDLTKRIRPLCAYMPYDVLRSRGMSS